MELPTKNRLALLPAKGNLHPRFAQEFALTQKASRLLCNLLPTRGAAVVAGLPLPPSPRRWVQFLAKSCLFMCFLSKGMFLGCGNSSKRAGGPPRMKNVFPSFLGLSVSAQPSPHPGSRRLDPEEIYHPPLPAIFFRRCW